jgi:hypothetical protein
MLDNTSFQYSVFSWVVLWIAFSIPSVINLHLFQRILDRCGLWGFNAFTLETVAGGRALPVLCVHLFHWYGLLDYFQLDVVRVWKLFSKYHQICCSTVYLSICYFDAALIEEGYHSTNPYHNSIHATDVTQAMHCFLQEEKVRFDGCNS